MLFLAYRKSDGRDGRPGGGECRCSSPHTIVPQRSDLGSLKCSVQAVSQSGGSHRPGYTKLVGTNLIVSSLEMSKTSVRSWIVQKIPVKPKKLKHD